MMRWALTIASSFQILLGINFHTGTEVFEQEQGEDKKLDYWEIQIGLIFILIEITVYKERGE